MKYYQTYMLDKRVTDIIKKMSVKYYSPLDAASPKRARDFAYWFYSLKESLQSEVKSFLLKRKSKCKLGLLALVRCFHLQLHDVLYLMHDLDPEADPVEIARIRDAWLVAAAPLPALPPAPLFHSAPLPMAGLVQSAVPVAQSAVLAPSAVPELDNCHWHTTHTSCLSGACWRNRCTGYNTGP
jgi:hypothetical protein